MNRKIKLLTALTMSSMILFSSVPVYASEPVSVQDDENIKEKSPKIKDVNIDIFASEGNTRRAYVKALGKDITYKFEILAEVVNKDGIKINEVENYTLLKEGLATNYVEWNDNDIKNNEGKTEEELQKEGKKLNYKLKVTVSNEFGEDSCVTNYDPNLIPMRPESLYLISATIGNNVYNINDNSVVYNCKVSDEVNINPTGFIYEGDKINYYVNDEKVQSSDNNYTFKPIKAGKYTIKLEGICANENESKEKYGIDNTMTITVNVTNNLKVAVDNKVLDDDQHEIKCNTNQKLYFVGETDYINYNLYVNDKLVDSRERNNELYYAFENKGIYSVKIEGISDDGIKATKEFNVVVEDISKDAPKIESINYSNFVGELNNINVDVVCKGNDVKYTYEFLREYDVMNMCTGYWCTDFNNYEMILDSSDKNGVEFTSPIDNNNNPKENGTVYRYKLKVTAKNDNGYDVHVINLDLNKNIVNKKEEFKHENNYLDVAVNNKVLGSDVDVINCNTNQNMYFVGETGSISYYLYINDKLVDKKFRNNEFNYTFTTPGEYNVKIVTDESCNGCNEDGVPSNKDDLKSRSFKVIVKDKDEKAPTIKEVKISNSVTDKNNVDLSVDCTGDNVKYTYEFLKKVVNNLPTGYWCKDFINFDVLSDNDSKNNLTFTVDKFNKEDYLIEKDQSFECDCYYTLKITATNEYGYDVQVFNIDLNENYEGKKINFIERIEYKDDENKDEDNKDLNKDDQNNKGQEEDNKDQDKEIAKEEDNKENDKEIAKEEDIKEEDKEQDNKSDISQDVNKNIEDIKNDVNKVNTRDNSHLGIITGLLGISLFSILRKKNK